MTGESNSFQEECMMNRSNSIAAVVCALCLLGTRGFVGTLAASAATLADDPASVKFYVAESVAAAGLNQAPVEGDPDKVVYLHEKPVLTEDDIAVARVVMDNTNRPAIDIAFTKAGQEKMAKATADNIGKRLAIVVNAKVLSAPRINSKIEGRAQVTGTFTQAEAEKLVQSIRPANQKSP
jgi:preprotein translocase subunit SecD